MPKLASSLMFGTAMADWQERIKVERMRQERVQKTRQVMKKHGVAACLLSREDNIRYVTGLRECAPIAGARYVLFFAEHDPIMFEIAGSVRQNPDQAPWLKSENWRISRTWLGGICGNEAAREEAKLFASEIFHELKQKGLASEKLAVTGFDRIANEALAELGIKTIDAQPLMLKARAVKTQDEINCMKMAVAIGDAAWYQIYDAVKPGIRDMDLTAFAAKTIAEMCTEGGSARLTAWSGPNGFERGYPNTDRRIQYGDLVYCDMHASFLGYQTCYIRTFCVGREPTDKEKDWYQRTLEKQNAIIDAIKPGATTADAAKLFPPASAWGYLDETYVLTIEFGHGVGLYLYEMPVINRQWSLKHPQVFEAGMTMAIESREGEWRVGAGRLEDEIVVTEDGAEMLSRTPRDRILVAHKIS